MSYRRVKDIAYEDDDYDEDEDDELSPEDQERMRQGIRDVKAALGSDNSVSEKEISDSLWHYYYDVEKSVAYFQSLKSPKQPKQQKKKEKSRFDQAASSAAQRPANGNKSNADRCVFPLYTTMAPNPADFFWDMPWGNISHHRNANLLHVRSHPAGGLLGGTSKPSKLAALAAARKKKGEEKKLGQPSTHPDETSRTISLLDRLGTKKEASPVSTQEGRPIVHPSPPAISVPVRTKRQPSVVQQPESEPFHDNGPEEPFPKRHKVQDIRAQPSAFAQALVGLSDFQDGATLEQGRKAPLSNISFALPYVDNAEYLATNPFAGPSPDDIVFAAQSKAKHLNPKSTQSSTQKTDTAGISDEVASLSVKDSIKVKHKNLDVMKEYEQIGMKNSASFVVIGHVDHGKSTLMGRLLYDLKVIDERTMEKLRRESQQLGKASFALAWIMDATSDERSRGVTVDTATSFFETENTKFTILDAPGHQDFIPNMIAGASQADFAVLVIDAGTNSFESGLRGQTKEHALLVRSMGVQRLIVAVNKMDKVSWSQERFTEIQQQMSAFLTSANFSPKALSFIPCAGLTGDNILSAPTSENASWYKGPTLVEELDNAEPTKRSIQRPLRMTISEVFKGSSANSISVAGRIDAGSLQVGDTVQIQPSSETAVVKSIEADNNAADWAVAGQMVSLLLTGIDPTHLRHGDIVCSTRDVVKNIKSFTAKILTFEHIMPMFVNVHRGPLHGPGKIVKLAATLDKSSGAVTKKKPRVVQPGSVARVVVELESEMPLEAGWRIVLRADGRSVAAGLVE